MVYKKSHYGTSIVHALIPECTKSKNTIIICSVTLAVSKHTKQTVQK